MFVHKSSAKRVLIFKHSEIPLLNLLDECDYRLLKNKFTIGYYFGGNYKDDIRYSPDFYICIPGLNDWLRARFDSIPWFQYSGFNFLPEFTDLETTLISNSNTNGRSNIGDNYVLYIGDFYERKGLTEAIEFFGNHSELKSKLVLRVSSSVEKLIAKIISFMVYCKSNGNIDVQVPQLGLNHPREQIFKWLKNADALLLPYKSEGAARVFAEAELFGRPVIYNNCMTGGTLFFSCELENIVISDYSAVRLSKLRQKNIREKKEIYLCKVTTIKYQSFLSDNFDINTTFGPNDLVNAFSGHRNDLDSQITTHNTDEIQNFDQLRKYLVSNEIFVPELPLILQVQNLYKEKIITFKKIVVKIKTYGLVFYAISKIKSAG